MFSPVLQEATTVLNLQKVTVVLKKLTPRLFFFGLKLFYVLLTWEDLFYTQIFAGPY